MDTNTRATLSPTNRRRNRRHPIEFKRAVVAQSYLPGSSVARLARDHAINANQIFSWRKLYRDTLPALATTKSTVLLPVNVVASSAAQKTVPAPKSDTLTSGTMEVVVGNARLTICGNPNDATLRIVLAHLLR